MMRWLQVPSSTLQTVLFYEGKDDLTHGGEIMLSILLLATLPVDASGPVKDGFFVDVDVIIVNRVRTHSTSYDDWGRPHIKCSEQWWVSFWEILWMPAIPGHAAMPIAWIDRGWWTCSHCEGVFPCTEGWMVESKDGINVTAPQLLVIDSPYDWEMKNRKIYRPITKP